MGQDSTEPKRDKQVRFRVYASEDEHLRKAAEDAGFEDKSAYLRAVLLAEHVVVVNGQGIVLIPAAASSGDERQAIADLLTEILGHLAKGSGQVPSSSASEAPDPAPGAREGVGGAPAGDGGNSAPEGISPPAPPSPSTSPGEGEGLVGASASHEPPEAPHRESHTPAPAAGSIPGPEENPAAGDEPPVDEPPGGVVEPTAEQQAAELAAETEGETFDPLPNPPLGPEIQPGETFEGYVDRRAGELKYQGRPIVIARYEAEAEYRRYAAAALAGAVEEVGPVAVPEQPTPGPIPCGNCGALKRSPGPCPDCGASV